MSQDLYQEIIIEEYKHPHNKGRLADADLTLRGGNASCGDQVTVFLKISEEKVVDIKWEGVGCSISLAAMGVLSQKIIDEQLSLEQIKKMTKTEMLAMLGLMDISTGRERCLMLSLKTLQTSEK